MVNRWAGRNHPGGGRIQAGVPQRRLGSRPEETGGLLLRGVVTATYVSDDSNHPALNVSDDVEPIAIYCDVLTYSSRVGQRTLFLRGCLVSQPTGGMHRGRIWKPRAATIDKTDPSDGQALDLNSGTNAMNLDGDHVLVGFLDNNPNMPVILRGIPHPSIDEGNSERSIGNRLRLKSVDGDPDFLKHHGSYYGIADNGDFVSDTRFANDGSLETSATEPAPPTEESDTKGSQRFELPLQASQVTTFYDMATPESPQAKATLTTNKDAVRVEFDQGLSFTVSNADDKLHLLFDGGFEFLVDNGNSVVHLGGSEESASVDSLVKAELGRITNEINNLKWELGKHRHPVPEFPIPLLFGDIVGCFKQPSIYLLKTKSPINLRTGSEVKAGNAPMDVGASTGEYFGVELGPTEGDLFPQASDPGDTFSETVKIKG